MIDFHSHILPEIDDGAPDTETSLSMLKKCAEIGVETVVLTPHCYFFLEEDIIDFVKTRNEKYSLLKEAMIRDGGKFPKVLLGAELHLSKFHSRVDCLKDLAIEGTNYILIEMPVGKWESDLYETLYSLSLKGLRPILAHIDRYLYGHRKDFHNLFSLDLAYQVNADAFLMRGIKKKMPYFFEHGAIHILGSDMHNLSERNTRMKEAKSVLLNKYGKDYYNFIAENSKLIINNEEFNIECFEKMKFSKRMKL